MWKDPVCYAPVWRLPFPQPPSPPTTTCARPDISKRIRQLPINHQSKDKKHSPSKKKRRSAHMSRILLRIEPSMIVLHEIVHVVSPHEKNIRHFTVTCTGIGDHPCLRTWTLNCVVISKKITCIHGNQESALSSFANTPFLCNRTNNELSKRDPFCKIFITYSNPELCSVWIFCARVHAP